MSAPSLGLIAWVALFLGVAWFCKTILNWSTSSLVKLAIKEFRHLATVKPTPLGFNALGTSICAILIILFYFHSGTQQILDGSSQSANGASSKDRIEWISIVMLGMFMFGFLLCLDICRKYGDRN